MDNVDSMKAPESNSPKKASWVSPEVIDLPRLADLTLQTGSGIPGGGGTGGGGSTVIL